MAKTPTVTEGKGLDLPKKYFLRPARTDDYDFALSLYLESTKPLLVALRRWDEEQIISRFAQGFKPEEIQILSSADSKIGWIQVSHKDREAHLDQLHLIEEARNRGIGTDLIEDLQKRARLSGRAVALNVIRGNRAQKLYERLGFRTEGGDEEKIRMVWRTDPPSG